MTGEKSEETVRRHGGAEGEDCGSVGVAAATETNLQRERIRQQLTHSSY